MIGCGLEHDAMQGDSQSLTFHSFIHLIHFSDPLTGLSRDQGFRINRRLHITSSEQPMPTDVI